MLQLLAIVCSGMLVFQGCYMAWKTLGGILYQNWDEILEENLDAESLAATAILPREWKIRNVKYIYYGGSVVAFFMIWGGVELAIWALETYNN